MKIEKQVCSFLQAKKLKELGVSQDSFLHWHEDENAIEGTYWTVGRMFISGDGTLSAFTVAELGAMLPPFPTWNWETYYHSGRRLKYGLNDFLTQNKTHKHETDRFYYRGGRVT